MVQTRVCLLLAALVAVSFGLSFPVASQSAPVDTVVAATPGAWSTTYATQVVVVDPSGGLTFANGDLMNHDVVSTQAGSDDEPWCILYGEGQCPIFWSRIIGLGETTEVRGLDNLESGQTYDFFCTIHPWMTGTLVAVDLAV